MSIIVLYIECSLTDLYHNVLSLTCIMYRNVFCGVSAVQVDSMASGVKIVYAMAHVLTSTQSCVTAQRLQQSDACKLPHTHKHTNIRIIKCVPLKNSPANNDIVIVYAKN